MSTVEVPAEVPAVVPAEDRIEFIRPTYEKVLDLFYQLKGQSVLCVEDVDRLSGMLGSVEEAIDEHIGWLNKQGYTMGGSYLSCWMDSYNYYENKLKVEAFVDMAYALEVEDEIAYEIAAKIAPELTPKCRRELAAEIAAERRDHFAQELDRELL